MNTIKHKKYKVISHHPSQDYSTVQDVETEKEYAVFLLTDKIGDEIYLFIKNYRNVFEDPEFEYSILNLYEEEAEYDFDIIKIENNVAVVSNYPNLRFAIPVSFLYTDASEIRLRIKSLNLNENKVFFDRPSQIDTLYKNIADFNFQEGVEYILKVENSYFNNNSVRFLVLDYNGEKLKTTIHPGLNDIALDDEVPFVLGYYPDGKPTLNVAKLYFNSKVYNVGERYSFVISNIYTFEDTEIPYWSLRDTYGYFNFYYPLMDKTFENRMQDYKEGDTINLYVSGFKKEGFLNLVFNYEEHKITKYLVEDLFKAIGYENKEETYFYNENYNNYLSNEKSENLRNLYLNQYEEGEDLWIFTYLSFLDDEVYRCFEMGDFERGKTLVDIYIKIEKWILEDSDYLNNFSESSVQTIILKAETKLRNYTYTQKALHLFLEYKVFSYVKELKEQVDYNPYLNPEKRNIFKFIVRLSVYFPNREMDSIIYELIISFLEKKFINDGELVFYIKSVESKIYAIERFVMQNMDNNEVLDQIKKEEMQFLIRNKFLVILLHLASEAKKELIITSVVFLRFFAVYKKDVRFVDLAIQLIREHAYLKPKNQNEYQIFDLPYDAVENMVYKEELKDSFAPNAGLIIHKDQALQYVPGNHFYSLDSEDLYLIASINSLDLHIYSQIEDMKVDFETDYLSMYEAITTYLNYEKEIPSIDYNNIDFDVKYIGRVKAFDRKGRFCFISSYIQGVKLDLLFHPLKFHQTRFNFKVQDFLKVGDCVQFKITSIEEDGKISIEGIPINPDIPNAIIDTSQKYKVKTILKSGNLNFAISEEGLPITFFDKYGKEGAIYELFIDSYNEEVYNFSSSRYIQIHKEFEGNPTDLWRDYLKKIGFILAKSRGDAHFLRDENNLNEDLIDLNKQLVYCLEYKAQFLDTIIDKIKYYFFIIVISSIDKNNRSYLFKNKLHNLMNSLRVKDTDGFEALKRIKNYLDKNYILTEKDKNIWELVEYMNSEEIQIPFDFKSASIAFKVQRLIESYNILKTSPESEDALDCIKQNIVTMFFEEFVPKELAAKKEFNTLLEEFLID